MSDEESEEQGREFVAFEVGPDGIKPIGAGLLAQLQEQLQLIKMADECSEEIRGLESSLAEDESGLAAVTQGKLQGLTREQLICRIASHHHAQLVQPEHYRLVARLPCLAFGVMMLRLLEARQILRNHGLDNEGTRTCAE